MGKWFDGFREGGKEEALEFGKKKNLPVLEVLEVRGGYRSYYVGEKLPASTRKGVGTRVRVLVLWEPREGAYADS